MLGNSFTRRDIYTKALRLSVFATLNRRIKNREISFGAVVYHLQPPFVVTDFGVLEKLLLSLGKLAPGRVFAGETYFSVSSIISVAYS